MRSIDDIPQGVISGLRFARNRNVVALTLATPTSPAGVYTYDPASGRLTRFTEARLEGMDASRFVSPRLIEVASFDGESIPLLYYRPAGSGPFPVLLWFHGGPEGQARPDFDPLIQFFVAELGIAVVAPNVRGSDGYGRRYLGLDDGSLRWNAVRDVGAVLDWIRDRIELDETRVGAHGASYGGYMVLASLVEYGRRIRAGCDMVGISNIVSFLENTSPYRRDLRRREYGDERDPAMRAALEAASPLLQASRIQSALFIAHGENDPRVPLSEAQAIASLVEDSGIEVWRMFARGEGHSFRKRTNRDRFYELLATFFKRHLVDGQVPASTADAD